MLFHIKAYLKYLLNSTNQHGVHSPFIFRLVTTCFYDKSTKSAYSTIRDYRKRLSSDQSEIVVTDFGAGSRVFKSNTRKVCDIAKNAGIAASRARLLFRMVDYLKPQYILEIGTSVGIATGAMAEGNRDAKITTLEGCPETATVASEMFRKFGYKNIDLRIAKFDSYLSEENLSEKKYDLIYFDGNHTKLATLAYFKKLLPTITNDSCWIFDDIHWSADMEEAWEEIKKNPQITVTIDTFQWGIVFFKNGQEKEHFVVRV